MNKQEITKEQIQLMSEAEFWDHYEMVAEAATQDPNAGGYSFDITELRQFQNEAHRRFEIIAKKPIDLVDPDPDAPNF